MIQDRIVVDEVSKEAFFLARLKLKPEVFTALNTEIIDEFYNGSHVQLWHGYRILSVDGTRLILPDEKPLKEKFGTAQSSTDNKNKNEVCMGQAIAVYDSLNKIALYIALDHVNTSETVMLYKALQDYTFNKNDILVFDRCYPSHLLCHYLHKLKIQFCFRMKTAGWSVVKRFILSGKDSLIVDLPIPRYQKAKEKAAALNITTTNMKCRLTKVVLETGLEEILLTSLIDEKAISAADTEELYGLRWHVEEGFKSYKTKLCLENFSGKSELAVRQDFHAKIFIANLAAVAMRPINTALALEIKGKHQQQVNIIEAIATLKKTVVSLFLTQKVKHGIKKLIARIAKITEPIRKGRKFKRKHKAKKRYYPSYKMV